MAAEGFLRVMYQALTVGLDFPQSLAQAAKLARRSLEPVSGLPPARPALAPVHGGVPGAAGPLGRCPRKPSSCRPNSHLELLAGGGKSRAPP